MIVRNPKEAKLDVLAYVLLLTGWKRFLILNTILWTAAAVVASYLLPKKYEAHTVLMPPKSSSEGLSKIMKGIPLAKLAPGAGSLLSAQGGSENLENLYLAILGSRTLHREVIDSFHLAHVYKFDRKKKYFVEDLEKEFQKHIGVEVADEGTFILKAEDESPERAAGMANFMAARLDAIYKRLSVETEHNQRVFLEQRLTLIKTDLDSAERKIVQFQKLNNMMDIDEQSKATIEAGTTMEAKYLAAELNLDINRRVFSRENPKIKEAEMELDELRRQRDGLLRERKSELLIPYKMAPDLGLQLVRLKRNLKIQETLFEMMMSQYESAKFEEAKNTPTVQVLDLAVAPEKRVFPKRAKIVAACFFLSLFAGIACVSLVEYFRRFREERPEDFAKLRQIRMGLWGRARRTS
jgi:tyrosine-protein kinase Etk/Wzc